MEDGIVSGVLPATVSGYVQLFVGAIVSYGIYHVVYNIYFHALSAFPGPKIAAVTRLYYIRYLLNGRLPFKVHELHEKYGQVVRVAPDELSITGAEGWIDIYGTRQGKPEMRKNPLFYSTTSSGAVGLFGSTRERHGPLRKLVSHGFSEKALREQESVVQGYCDLLMKRVYERCKGGMEMVDFNQWYNFFTFDVIGDLAFGESFGCLEKGEYHPWVAAIFDNVKASSWLRSLGYYPFMQKLSPILMPRKLREKRAVHHRMTTEKVNVRRNQKTDRSDFLSGFLQEDADVSEIEMINTARTVIIAGSETTATLLCGITYLLLKHPDVMKKLVDEVRSTFKSESEITFIGVNKLRYMLACLDEAMRVYPPAPGSFPRDVPPGGDRVGEYFVPEQTIIATPHYANYHLSQNFHLPNDFIPERWLGDERFANDNKAAFMPFSNGPRNCVGRNLAYVEMRTVLARLLWNFNLAELDAGSQKWIDHNIYLLWEKPELLVRLEPVREPTNIAG